MGAPTMKLDLPYLYRQEDRYGNKRYYFRKSGKKQRIEGDPGTEAFHAAYSALLTGATARPPSKPKASAGPAGSLKWLCERYYAVGEFKNLGVGTQRVRRGILDNICTAEWRNTGMAIGSLPFAKMDRTHVREIKDQKADFPEAANGQIKALRQVFRWAKEAGHVDTNPALDVPYLHKRTNGHHTWTVPEVYQYWERWPLGTREHLAMMIMLCTGARRGDTPKLGRGMERNGELTFRAQKTGEEVTMPIRHELRRAIDACPSGHMTYLVTEFGKPFTGNGFGNWFADRCRKAGVPGRAHGLRKAGATILADNGATAHELMSIYGWSDLKEAEVYTRQANRTKLARSGMAKMELTHKTGIG